VSQVKPVLDLVPVLQTARRSGLLQRACDCGRHTVASGECEECRLERQGKPQRAATNPTKASDVSSGPLARSAPPHMDASTRGRARLYVSQPSDRYEQEADRVAEQVMQTPTTRPRAIEISPIRRSRLQRQVEIGEFGESEHEDEEEELLQAKVVTGKALEATADVQAYVGAIRGSGQPLPQSVRSQLEPRFGHDFGDVRIHADARAAQAARAVSARAFTIGRDVVFGAGQYAPGTRVGQHLLAHELTHVVQQGGSRPQASTSLTAAPACGATLQRKVLLHKMLMSAKERAAFVKARTWANRTLASAVMQDMADAGDTFDFADEAELEREIVKRVSTSEHMKESQKTFAGDKKAFGYPFTSPAALYGPRVNHDARDYWQPAVPDNYAVRTDKKKNADLMKRPRHERCHVYNDPCGTYSWKLTDKGKADVYQAIVRLFNPQQPHKRTLIHCDYLVSLVQFRSFADAVGVAEFNKRVKAFGLANVILRWNAFDELHVEMVVRGVGGRDVTKPALGSLQSVQPSSEADLIIGDHVVFYNHIAYDLINAKVGNAWRLENAVLIGKQPNSKDIFLGHGSGRQTTLQMKAILAGEYNKVVRMALDLTKRAQSPGKGQAPALNDLSTRFPHVTKVAGEWRVQGTSNLIPSCPHIVDVQLREISESDVLGLKNPCDPTTMWWVQRPIESK
jgi:Domain of unknown function (DUF4157)